MARKATWQHHTGPHKCLNGGKVARTCGRTTRVHANTQVVPRGIELGWQLMGPHKSTGAVTLRGYAALAYILTYPTNFLLVGLCSLVISSLKDT